MLLSIRLGYEGKIGSYILLKKYIYLEAKTEFSGYSAYSLCKICIL